MKRKLTLLLACLMALTMALTGAAEKELCDAAESYLLTQLERSFYTLDFYKSLLTE